MAYKEQLLKDIQTQGKAKGEKVRLSSHSGLMYMLKRGVSAIQAIDSCHGPLSPIALLALL